MTTTEIGLNNSEIIPRDEAVRRTRGRVKINELLNFDKKPSAPVKVSVIVPVCNVEMYLRECLDSIIAQTLKEIEIICVNDGSKDSCPDILREYAAKDDRIKVINKDNAGYGHAMNIGMDMAQGEYIGIVESDDFVVPEMYEELYKVAKDNSLDFVKADFNRFKVIDGKIVCDLYELSKDKDLYGRVLDISNTIDAFKLVMNTWSGIYSRKFLEENNIRHNETPGASYQDNGFWFQTFSHAKRGYFVNKPYYMNRRDNPNSSVFSKSKAFCMCDEYKYIRELIERDYDNMKHLLPAYHFRKFGNYMFTYNRVGAEYKLPFLRQFHDEFRAAYDNGELDISLFNENDRNALNNIIRDDYEEYFVAEYVDKLDWNRSRVKKLEAIINRLHIPDHIDFSIVVPVFNAADYLDRCLDSLVSQDYKNYEIICVDDGSTDNSSLILSKFQKSCTKLRVISTENMGVSHARNTGIKAAEGKYIIFVDADDFIERKTLSIVSEKLQKSNADILVYGGSSTGNSTWANNRMKTGDIIISENVEKAVFEIPASKPFVWNKAVRKSLIVDNDLFFDENMKICEDQLWCFSIIPLANKVQSISNKLYHYFDQNKNSAMKYFEQHYAEKSECHVSMLDDIYAMWTKNGWLDSCRKEFVNWLVMTIESSVLRLPFNKRRELCLRYNRQFGDLFEEYSNDFDNEYLEECYKYIRSVIDYSGNIEVSVIMPVYNSQDYLRECLDSVCSQRMQDIEIICVDDGSTDGSLEILNEYAANDSRMQVLTQENLYAGVARNNGMKHARGKYLMFLDSDDFFSTHLVSKMYNKIIENDCDICICDGKHYHTDTGVYEQVHSLLNHNFLPETEPFSHNDIPNGFYNLTSSVVWNKMFKKEFVEKHGLDFAPTRTANDVYFVNLSLAFAEKITYVTDALAFYRVGMTTNLQSVKKDVPLDFYDQFIRVRDRLIETDILDTIHRTFCSVIFSNILYHLNTIASYNGFCKVFDKFINDGISDFRMEPAFEDSDFFVMPWLNTEFAKITQYSNGTEYVFSKFRKFSSDNAVLLKDRKELEDKLEWNRGERIKASEKLFRLGNDVTAAKNQAETLKREKDSLAAQLKDTKAKLAELERSKSKLNAENKKLRSKCTWLRGNWNAIQSSFSFKLGRVITWLPRKIKGIFSHN